MSIFSPLTSLVSAATREAKKVGGKVLEVVSSPFQAVSKKHSSQAALTAPVGEGMSEEQKQKANTVIQKQVSNQKKDTGIFPALAAKQKAQKILTNQMNPAPEGSVLGGVKKIIGDVLPILPAAERAIEQKSLAPIKQFGGQLVQTVKDSGKTISEGVKLGATKEQRGAAISKMMESIDIGSTGEIKKKVGREVVEAVAPKVKKIIEKGEEAVAKSLPTDFLSELRGSLKGRSEKPGGVERAMKEIKEGISPPVRVRTIENGEKIIEDGGHRVEAYKRLGIKDIPIEDVTSKYGPIPPTIKPPKKTLPNILEDGMPEGFDPKAYVKENIAKREAARTAEKPGIVSKIKQVYSDLKSNVVDSNSPIEDTLRKAAKENRFEVLPEKDITDKIDRVYRAPQIAGQFAKENGLEAVVKNVDDLDTLDEYLIAKQAQAVEAKGIKTGRNIKKDKALVEAYKEQYEPFAKTINDYSQKLLKTSVEKGLISSELSEKLIKQYPEYVPLARIFSELERGTMGRKGVAGSTASLSRQTVVQRLVGSEREIESPLASLLTKTQDVFMQGERNQAALTLTSYEKIPGNPFGLRKLADGEKVPAGQGTISVLRNGKKELWIANKDIVEAAKRLNVEQANILQRILLAPIRIAKVGITGLNLPFMGANLASDQLMAFINSKHPGSTANPVNFVKAFMGAVGHGQLYDDWVRAGAGGTSFDMSRDAARSTLETIRSGRSLPSKIKYTVTHPGELLRAIENVVGRSEEITRLQQFEGTRQALLKQGRTAKDAEILAAKASRGDTANFFRKGNWGNAIQGMFLYLNAGIQGSRSWIQSFKANPIKTGAKLTTTLLFPTAALTAWNLSDPDRKAAYEDIAPYEKEGNFIFVPPNPTKDEDGKWNVIKIKMPPGLSKLTIPVRRALEQMHGMDEVKFTEIANSLFSAPLPFDVTKVENGEVGVDTNSILSTLTPQIIKPSIEAFANKNFFTGLPQVSRKLEGLSPELQVKDNTSGAARKIGGALDVSPIKVEEFIKGTAGGVGSQVLNLVDRALAKMDIIPEDQIGGQNVLKAISARFTKASGGGEDQKQIKELTDVLQAQADESFRKTQEAELLFKEMKSLPQKEAASKWNELNKKDKILARKIKDIATDEKLGLSYDDRLLKKLGVENGARAKFIYEKAMAMDTQEERVQYLNELSKKKITTKEVNKQIKYLIKQKKAE